MLADALFAPIHVIACSGEIASQGVVLNRSDNFLLRLHDVIESANPKSIIKQSDYDGGKPGNHQPCSLFAPSPSTFVRFSKSSPAVTPNFLTKSLAAPSKSP